MNWTTTKIWLGLVTLAVLPCSIGCSTTNRYCRTWDLSEPQDSHVDSDGGRGAEAAQAQPSRQIRIGMTKSQILGIAEPCVEKFSDDAWSLKNQFHLVSPELYPFFDSRKVYLYFDDDEKLAAINIRGAYTMYP